MQEPFSTSSRKAHDASDMLGQIRSLPDQLETAWDLGLNYTLPKRENLKHIIIAGMGGSAIGADIVSGYAKDHSNLPISVIRGYSLPKYVSGLEYLVICSSHSGNTEETLSVFEQAISRNCSVLAISTGGKLKERAVQTEAIYWQFDHSGQPRAAIGYSFGLLYCLLSRLELVSDGGLELKEIARGMRELYKKWDIEKEPEQNLSKRIAGQAIGRTPIYFGAEHLEPIARRWKTQTNELAKSIAGFEFMPEANHNSLAGLENPEKMLPFYYAIFLNSEFYNERNSKRMRLTASEYLVSGICTDQLKMKAGSKLGEIWQYILLGDFITYYLALSYGIDPTPIERLEFFKQAMKKD